MTFADLQRVNASIKTTNIKGKEYAEVFQRIKAFRMLYPEGFIRTSYYMADGMVIFSAEVGEGDRILATGTAYERENSNQINRTSFIENCETSAVGRALAMMGIGIDVSVASAEEVSNAIYQQESMKQEKKEVYLCENCGRPILDGRKRNGETWLAKDIAFYTKQGYGKALCSVCATEMKKNEGKTS